MKTLNDYINDAMSKVYTDNKAFFAFNEEQLKVGLDNFNLKKEDVRSLGAGLICFVETIPDFLKQRDDVVKAGIAQRLKDYGKERIIINELYNHEAFYSGDLEYTIELLEDYGITAEETWSAYQKELPEAEML